MPEPLLTGPVWPATPGVGTGLKPAIRSAVMTTSPLVGVLPSEWSA